MATAQAVLDGKLTNEQLGILFKRHTEVVRRLNEGTLDYDWTLMQLQRVIEGKATTKPPATVSPLFTFVATVDLPGCEAFSVRATLETGQSIRYNVCWNGNNFRANFLHSGKGAGRKELDVPATKLRVSRLTKSANAQTIVDGLGGSVKAKLALAYVAHLISRQPNGKSGVLLTNGCANLFPVEDNNGDVWLVSVFWRDTYRGWCVEADPLSGTRCWHADDQVFSSDSDASVL